MGNGAIDPAREVLVNGRMSSFFLVESEWLLLAHYIHPRSPATCESPSEKQGTTSDTAMALVGAEPPSSAADGVTYKCRRWTGLQCRRGPFV